MKTLITKSDGTPTKSKVHALQFLAKNGISKDCLIEEKGQFFYEEKSEQTLNQVQGDSVVDCHVADAPRNDSIDFVDVSWETPVYDANGERTQLIIPGTDIIATINAKHPAGQNRTKSAFEINIENENFIMSVELLSKIFKVAAAGALTKSKAQSGERG